MVVRSFESMLIGFTDAAARFDEASKAKDATGTANALFEALNWAVTLDERVAKHWAPDGEPVGWDWRDRIGHGAVIMGGVRFARNSVHHDWSDAVYLDQSGFTFPISFPLGFFEWRWRPTDQLPEPDQPPRSEQEAIYRGQMELRPVRHHLDLLNGAFYYLAGLMEPAAWRAEVLDNEEEDTD